MAKNPDYPTTRLTKEQIADAVRRSSGRDPDNPIVGSQAYADKKAADSKDKENPK
jgi:hypothetical protein